LNTWITNNYEEIKTICHKVTKSNDIDDLLQICVEQFITNKKIDDIPDEQKLYFFTKIVKNNYYSTTSKYYNTYHKYKFSEFKEIEIPDNHYDETEINLDWVNKQLQDIKKDQWYYGRLFELYLQVGCSITKLSQKTTIPINTVSRDINKVRKELKKRRNGMWM